MSSVCFGVRCLFLYSLVVFVPVYPYVCLITLQNTGSRAYNRENEEKKSRQPLANIYFIAYNNMNADYSNINKVTIKYQN